jgi:hypothetical protein
MPAPERSLFVSQRQKCQDEPSRLLASSRSKAAAGTLTAQAQLAGSRRVQGRDGDGPGTALVPEMLDIMQSNHESRIG